MPVGLVFAGNQYASINPAGSIGAAVNVDLIINMRIDAVTTYDESIILGAGGNSLSLSYFEVSLRTDGSITVATSDDGGGSVTFTPPALGVVFTLKVSFTGLNAVSGAKGGTCTVYLDDVQQGSSFGAASHPFVNGDLNTLGGQNNTASTSLTTDDTNTTLFSLQAVSENYDYNWTGEASDSTTTGVQPVLVDANASAVTIDGYQFPTDGSQWVEVGPGITVTPADLPLTPGGTISGTYADYATVPTTLTVSDGTNTITIPTPDIVDDAAGGGTFSGTMPALPSTGTASLVLFGNVTVELS